MSWRPERLKVRLLLWFGGVLGGLLLAFAALLYLYSSSNLRHKVLAQIRETALEAEGRILAQKNLSIHEGILKIHLPPHTDAALIRQGHIVARTRHYDPTLCRPLERSGEEFLLAGSMHLDACYWERFKRPFSGAVVLQKRDIPNDTRELMKVLGLVLPVLLLLLLLAAWRLIDRILEPLRRLKSSIDRVSVEHFSQTIAPPERDDEIRDLTEAYNAMILRLREGVETLERFNADLAHELRTPLTAMRGEIELALRRQRSADALREALQRVQKELEGMERLTEGLLLLSRYTRESVYKSFESCDPARLVAEQCDAYRMLAQERQITLHCSGGKIKRPGFRCNPLLLSRLISNLLDNAIKYSDPGTGVEVELSAEGGGWELRVQDHGIGIAPEKLAHITERFYRADEARSRQIQGFGLGLAIVQRVAELHDATVRIVSAPGEGTTVEVRFPAGEPGV